MVMLVLAGCSDNGKQDQLSAQLQDATQRIDELERANGLLTTEVAALRSQARPDTPPATADNDLRRELQELRQRVTELEAIEHTAPQAPGVRAAPEEGKPAEGTPAKTDPAEAAPATQIPEGDLRRLENLLPLIKAPNGEEQLFELAGVAEKSTRSFRDEFIKRMQEWVASEPENSRARLGLALALTSRFRDIRGDMMKQATLASDVRKETERALELDPDYYTAVHFLAILKVNYPPFAQEFQGAKADLDKALEMQAQLPWEDDFCEIYAAYGMWYRKQGKLDEALAKVNAGLAKAPQHAGLLAEKKAIEAQSETNGD